MRRQFHENRAIWSIYLMFIYNGPVSIWMCVVTNCRCQTENFKSLVYNNPKITRHILNSAASNVIFLAVLKVNKPMN